MLCAVLRVGGGRRHDTLSMTARHFCMSARNLRSKSRVVAAEEEEVVVAAEVEVEVVVVLLDDDDKRDGGAAQQQAAAWAGAQSTRRTAPDSSRTPLNQKGKGVLESRRRWLRSRARIAPADREPSVDSSVI